MPNHCTPPALFFTRKKIMGVSVSYTGSTTGNAYFRVPLAGPRVRCMLAIFWEPATAMATGPGGTGASWNTWSPRGAAANCGTQVVNLGLEYGQFARESLGRAPSLNLATERAAGSLYGSLRTPLVLVDGTNDETYRGYYGQEILSAHDSILGRLQMATAGFQAGDWWLQVAHFPEIGLPENDWQAIRVEIQEPVVVEPADLSF